MFAGDLVIYGRHNIRCLPVLDFFENILLYLFLLTCCVTPEINNNSM